MRLIDADALSLGKFIETRTEWHQGWNDALDAATTQAPTIEAEPVRHGRWKDVSMDTVCSVCGTKFNDEMYWIQGDGMNPNYCPECGAKMDAKEEPHEAPRP